MAGKTRMLGFMAAVVCTLVPAGCKDKEREKALVEAEQTQAELNKVRGDLARTRREMADLRKELAAAKETRDELHLKVEQLLKERSGVTAAAEKTQETVRALTAQSTEQAQSVESLQKEIKQLKTLVETQQTLITEQQATISELRKTPEASPASTGNGEDPAGQQGGGEPNETPKNNGSGPKTTVQN